jgi:nascent polypeptide-associated complex subunit alpha
MIPNINPRQMQAMMKQMGISQTPIRARKVIFETEDGNLVINNPDVLKVMMQGQETYQITGHAILEIPEEESSFSDDDIEMVISQTHKDRESVAKALESTDGDIAEAIIKLKEIN